MKRPARVRILGKPFTISFVPPDNPALHDEVDGRLVGRCSVEAQHIHVADNQPLENEQDTTLHEILHAVDSAMGETEAAEEVIRRLATGLLAVLKDNPSLFRYLAAKK